MLQNKHLILFVSLCASVISLLCCNMGGSTEQGNARISGSISGGTAHDSIFEVQLVAAGYNPFDFTSGYVFATTTISGRYTFVDIPFGTYYLYAFNYGHRYTTLSGPFTIDTPDLNTGTRQLEKSGVVSVMKTASGSGNLYYVNGTSHAAFTVSPSDGTFQLQGVPSGQHVIMETDTLTGSLDKTGTPFTEISITPGDTISVTRNNTGPVISIFGRALPTELSIDSVYQLSIYTSDPEGDSISLSVMPALKNGSVETATGLFIWKPSLSDIPIRQLTFRATDEKGAWDEISIPVSLQQPLTPPQPQPPTIFGSTRSGSELKISTLPADCITGSSLFRFSFGNGDTSAWVKQPDITYQWFTAGTFDVSVQTSCSDYVNPSLWSTPAQVTISKLLPPKAPDIKLDRTEIVLGDSVLLHTLGTDCGTPPLYNFTCNNKDSSGWISSSSYSFTPEEPGTWEIKVQVWCDTGSTLPSEYSAIQKLTVLDVSLPLPKIKAPSNFTLVDTFTCQCTIISDTLRNGNPIDHRFQIETKSLADSTNTALFLSVNLSCDKDQGCPSTIPIKVSEISDWHIGSEFTLILLKPEANSYTIKIQARDRTTLKESPWNSCTILPPN